MADFNFEDVLAAINAQPDSNASQGVPTEDVPLDPSQWNDYVQPPSAQWDEFVAPTADPDEIVFTPEEAAGVDIIFDPTDPDVAGTGIAPPTPIAPQGPTSPPAAQLRSVGQSHSVSSSSRGIAGGPGTVAALYADADARTGAVVADAEARYAQEQARYQGHFDGLAEATRQQAEIEKSFHERQLEHLDRQRDFLEMHAKLEERIAAQAKVEGERYLGAYKDQLVAVRALAAQDANPLHKGNTALGLAGAAFAQGYLAARGVHIDVTGQIDRWVDRELQQHQQRVQNARGAASDTLHLYEVARESARDDAEARQRYKGMVLESLKMGVTMEAEKFGSDIARSRAQETVARLQIEQDKIFSSVRERQEKTYRDLESANLTRAYQAGSLLMQQHSQSETRRHNRAMEGLERLKASKQAQPDVPVKVSDPGAVVRDGNGRVVATRNMWRQNPNVTDAQRNKAQEKSDELGERYATVKAGIERAKALRQKAQEGFLNKYGPDFIKKMSSEEKRTYEREKKLLMMEARHAMAGAALTEFEQKEWDSLLANDSGWEAGSNSKALEQFEKHFRDPFVNYMNQSPAFVPLTAEEQDQRAFNSAPNETDADYNASLHGGPPVITNLQKEEGEASHGNTERIPAHAAWRKFMGADQPDALLYKTEEFETMPEWARKMDHLAKVLVDPEFRLNASGIPELDGSLTPPSVLHREAYQAMDRLSSDESLPTNRRAYAKYLYDRAETDEDGLLEDYSAGSDGPGVVTSK